MEIVAMVYQIRKMEFSELSIAVDWAAKFGWNPGSKDESCFYNVDQAGFFTGTLNEQCISFGSAVCYDEKFAFCGFYMVDESHRGKGYGMALTRERLAYVGERITGIDGVLENEEIYQRIGYETLHHNIRYEFINPFKDKESYSLITTIKPSDIDDLSKYDQECFPAVRTSFLNCWISKPERIALMYIDKGKIKGYGILRPAFSGMRIGPLFADSPAIGRNLFRALLQQAGQNKVYLDVPSNNPNAQKIVDEFKGKSCFVTARMYRNGIPNINQDKIYGITSFELG